ncbi:response regulator [Priestia flexa]|uniref:Response regulator n=1 Tax=Priestia flexa TaxID=86664 RepID=A0ABU4JAG0_9BACI|nr:MULTISPECIES: response regulator [Bacillaceae]KZB92475.1 DNA-binding response regulator [Bacillus sp. VT 712]MBY6086808.1 response regulator [Priestia flexa]MDW8517971.1 response regulator [Priestia flexa]MEC0666010.1 response regulator [Priestia flexa]MED3824051.1 response regulator [Priestia flexa]
MKALIVDDEKNVRKVMRQLGEWESVGINEVLEATNGIEALEIIEKEKPGVIFTDIKMPKMSGLQLIERLNQHSYTGKVILVTGYDDYTFMRKAIQLNSFDYLLKPIDPEAFQQVLTKVVDSLEAEQEENEEILAEAKKLRHSQLMTSLCLNEGTDTAFLHSIIPEAEDIDFTLLYFYQGHQPDPCINELSNELQARNMGATFTFQGEENLYIVLTAKHQWVYVERWISENISIPIRLVQDSFSSFNQIPEVFNGLLTALKGNQYRAIRQVDELEALKRMQEIVAYVEDYYMEDISLQKLSKMFFLTREHISRKFKKETGMTLSKYVTNLRVRQAKQWLLETAETIHSISLMLGYQDEKYFSKLFKKVVGLTPFEYRALYANVRDSEKSSI